MSWTPPPGQRVPYFAYGANLDRAHLEMWCPRAAAVGRATLPDYRLVFRTWADLVASPGDVVLGALYELARGDLAALDASIGCPDLYHRIEVQVRAAGHLQDAVAYRMNPGHAIALPDPDYLRLIVQGYKDWALDTDHLTVLERPEHDALQT